MTKEVQKSKKEKLMVPQVQPIHSVVPIKREGVLLPEEVKAKLVVSKECPHKPKYTSIVETKKPIGLSISLPNNEFASQTLTSDAVKKVKVFLSSLKENEVAEENIKKRKKLTKEGFFSRLKLSLLKTKKSLGFGFISLFRGKNINDHLYDELEEQLLISDVGVETTCKIIPNLIKAANYKRELKADSLYGLLQEEMAKLLKKVDKPIDIEGKKPFIILMVGVNGVGKTTTSAKLAYKFKQDGKLVMLAAGDTFRAAAIEQIRILGERNNIPVVAQHIGADSASVIFDAIQAAIARHIDVLIIDTAGRLQNKIHLMEDLKKIVRVIKKIDVKAPHEIMLAIDASTGQNAVRQVNLFHEAIGLTGITLTKLDGTAKGGVIFSVADQFNIPIRYIGIGEHIEDLYPFKSDEFVEALFARENLK